jgi:hypothetical protein
VRPPSRNRGRSIILSALLGIGIGTAACGDENPVGPSAANQQEVTAQSITISGSAVLQRPSDTAQLTATATFSDGSARNVSSEAQWTVDHPNVVSVARGGLVTARGYGQCNVTVNYGALSARVPVRVLPEGMFLLSGRITEESGLPLWQAQVSINSSSAQVSTSTDQEGVYVLPARGDVEVRVEMVGFEVQVRRVTVAQDQGLDFQLRFKADGFGGMYRLVFIASSSCALPADAMRRSYIARVVEASTGSLSVVLSGAEFVSFGEAGFTGRRDGSSVRFEISSDFSADYQFIEQLDGNRELAFSGIATGLIGDTFATVFSGQVVVRQRTGTVLAQCDAADHRLEFTR